MNIKNNNVIDGQDINNISNILSSNNPIVNSNDNNDTMINSFNNSPKKECSTQTTVDVATVAIAPEIDLPINGYKLYKLYIYNYIVYSL